MQDFTRSVPEGDGPWSACVMIVASSRTANKGICEVFLGRSQAMTRVVAHRGAAQEAPENSVQAFLHARLQGADGVELDVRRSRDGALVVNHDATVEGLGAICDLAVADLPSHVALLSEIIEACAGMEVNVEIKNSPGEPGHDPTGSLVTQVLAELADLAHPDGLIISSFDLETMEAVHRGEPTLRTGLLLEPGADLVRAVELAADRGFTAIHPFVIGCTTEVVAAAHAAGIAVNVWTVDAEHDAISMAAMGVDAIITDDVPMVRRVVDGPH